MTELTYSYSRVSANAVGELVGRHYPVQIPLQCRFYVMGLHDNYLIESGDSKYILRIYRSDWRSQEEIDFELELLAWLTAKTSRVAAVLANNHGELKTLIECPEGPRAAALFAYAEGVAPGKSISVEESILLGQTVAAVHEITQTFTSSRLRPVLDLPYLLDASLVAINPFMDKDARTYLSALQEKLHRALPVSVQAPGVYGICIGDVNSTNFHIGEDKRITLFDFDQCGYGYRAFEIAKFIASIHTLTQKQELTKAFIEGYQQLRRLNSDEMRAIPYYEIVAMIWVMAIHVCNAEQIGYKQLERSFWARRLANVMELDSQLF